MTNDEQKMQMVMARQQRELSAFREGVAKALHSLGPCIRDCHEPGGYMPIEDHRAALREAFSELAQALHAGCES